MKLLDPFSRLVHALRDRSSRPEQAIPADLPFTCNGLGCGQAAHISALQRARYRHGLVLTCQRCRYGHLHQYGQAAAA